jgi:hypothetical protein
VDSVCYAESFQVLLSVHSCLSMFYIVVIMTVVIFFLNCCDTNVICIGYILNLTHIYARIPNDVQEMGSFSPLLPIPVFYRFCHLWHTQICQRCMMAHNILPHEMGCESMHGHRYVSTYKSLLCKNADI